MAELREFSAKVIGEDFKESYPFSCPACGHALQARPSIFMTGFGINQGGGTCTRCKANFSLRIADDNARMIAEVR